jgi:hypothetical protein
MHSPVFYGKQGPGNDWLAINFKVLAQRKPTLLFLLFGLFLLRLAQRAESRLLFHEPPRSSSGNAPLEDHASQHSFPELPGVSMGNMANPAPDTLVYGRQWHRTPCIFLL